MNKICFLEIRYNEIQDGRETWEGKESHIRTIRENSKIFFN